MALISRREGAVNMALIIRCEGLVNMALIHLLCVGQVYFKSNWR